MSEKRYFLEGVKLGKNTIDGEEHLHLSSVMRERVGNEILLVGNDEFEYKAKILDIKKNFTEIEVFEKNLCNANPKIEVTAFIAMNKREHMNLMVRMLSELGVTTFVPVITKWTLKQDQTDKVERYQKIAQQSTKQCGRSKVMNVEKPQKLADACKHFADFDKVFFAYENENKNALSGIDGLKKIAFIIGPVAGFDKDEAELINKSGATPITLGKRILRADTATIALAGAIMNACGEWEE